MIDSQEQLQKQRESAVMSARNQDVSSGINMPIPEVSIRNPYPQHEREHEHENRIFPVSTPIDQVVIGTADVAIFWDFENVRIPAWYPATTVAECIRNKVARFGRIVEKRLYYDSRQPLEISAPRSDLDLSGFTLVDCPSRNRKETLDKKLIVDVLFFAWERSSRGAKACVVLITSDGDYSYALARLRDIGIFTVIVYKPDIVAKVLIDNANVVMSWEFDVLGGPPDRSEDYVESESNGTLLGSAVADKDITQENTRPLTSHFALAVLYSTPDTDVFKKESACMQVGLMRAMLLQSFTRRLGTKIVSPTKMRGIWLQRMALLNGAGVIYEYQGSQLSKSMIEIIVPMACLMKPIFG